MRSVFMIIKTGDKRNDRKGSALLIGRTKLKTNLHAHTHTLSIIRSTFFSRRIFIR